MILAKMRLNVPMPAIGEALVDGKALKWEYYKPTDIMGEKEIEKLTVAEMKELEEETMERNAWRVSEEVVSRIDGEPGTAGDCMKALVTNKRHQQFFFNTEYLQKYNAAKSEKKKIQVPGHHLRDCDNIKHIQDLYNLPDIFTNENISSTTVINKEFFAQTVRDNTNIIDRDDNWNLLLYKEAYHIKRLTPFLNNGLKASRELRLFS